MMVKPSGAILAAALLLGAAVSASAQEMGTDVGVALDDWPAGTMAYRASPPTDYRLAQIIHGRQVQIRTEIPRIFGFQGQCTVDDDCGTWKCCNTSCEDVDVCP